MLVVLLHFCNLPPHLQEKMWEAISLSQHLFPVVPPSPGEKPCSDTGQSLALPDAPLSHSDDFSNRYHWECATASSPARPCFDSSTAHQLDAAAPTVSFEAQWLSDSYDQFLVMLRVSSGGRNSSEARVFLSPYPDSALRYHLPCVQHSSAHKCLLPPGASIRERNLLCTASSLEFGHAGFSLQRRRRRLFRKGLGKQSALLG